MLEGAGYVFDASINKYCAPKMQYVSIDMLAIAGVLTDDMMRYFGGNFDIEIAVK